MIMKARKQQQNNITFMASMRRGKILLRILCFVLYALGLLCLVFVLFLAQRLEGNRGIDTNDRVLDVVSDALLFQFVSFE
jgi:uncharacterized SAM-binding protein YcdF (DUF218 family)